VTGVTFSVPPAGAETFDTGKETLALMIDGNRDGDYVLFDHDAHVANLEQRDGFSCELCHHMKRPYEKVGTCAVCHTDMYLRSDIFDHSLHVVEFNGNVGCVECHTDPSLDKVPGNIKPCRECHETMRPAGTLVDIPEDEQSSGAPGYMIAMHEMCISCHEKEVENLETPSEDFARCANCHRDFPDLEDDVWRSHL
jgi:hypothetical protein